jgi:2-C-methyl-D-erythritol 4-phosphate cytidylyltransferase/2-C-methyl-D-erythritol 2,4-cyclodiphosphate synthase
MSFSAVIVAGGAGERAGPGGAKQWRTLAGKAVARWSLEAMLAAKAVEVVVVIPPGDEAAAAEAFAGLEGWRTATGGATRHLSVQAGLAALAAEPQDIVLIHDAARPFLSPDLARRVAAEAQASGAALPGLPVADTLKRRTDGPVGLATVPRDGLWRAQTPQGFRRSLLEAAYAAWPASETPTDDASVVERTGAAVVLVEGDPRLIKLTYPEDFAMAEALVAATRTTRIGMGFDAHRFGPGESVWLCGVEISHSHGLVGHSDADAGLHALTDAILGAIGEGDIGDHFPPSDPKWRGAPSSIFLRHAAELVAARGGRIVNVDVTLICEQPKIKPHRHAMRARIAELLGLETDKVSVKATTTEAMGFTGREEGLAAQAVTALDLPS